MDYLQQLDDEQLEALAKELGQLLEEDLPLFYLDPDFLNPVLDFGKVVFLDSTTNSTLPAMDEAKTLEKIDIPDLILDLSEAPLEKLSSYDANMNSVFKIRMSEYSTPYYYQQLGTDPSRKINHLTNYIKQLQPFLQHIRDTIHDLLIKYKKK
ncbi:uncharacterized protein CIMG_12163 [Coccidioides immitis RS]|uniref:Uncharacterized protein n=1 Tax=Coccidioides immitis (strain RS) TaxID=246410 RepID=A0A0D8JV20_COCIM|nr:uncharacterized protein CIMG_12163 [Coccidioides immitis RS]KJF60776.1 hypothetical protein CIMG_12163 [Coccidioides immitis RS]